MAILLTSVAVILILFGLKLNSDQIELRGQINHLQEKIRKLELQLAKYLSPDKQAADPQTYPTAMAEKIRVKDEPQTPRQHMRPPAAAPKNKPENPLSWRNQKTATSATTQHLNLKDFEEGLSARWLLWGGGLAFALGSGFLVKHSIDAGLLNPKLRVSLGFVMGMLMIIGGEILRQRRIKLDWFTKTPDYLPSAISAAGLFSAFAAVYASYALYEFLPAFMAFTALAFLSFVASGLAYYQGRFFAYLGLIGGMIIPLLVSTGSSAAWSLFPYLMIVLSASLWVSRQKAWVDVASTTLILSLLWAIAWILTNWTAGDIIPVGIYLILLGGLNSSLLNGASPPRITDSTLAGLVPDHIITVISDLVMMTGTILLICIIRLDHYSVYGFLLLFTAILGQGYAVYRSPEYDPGAIILLTGIVFLFATWHLPALTDVQNLLAPLDGVITAWGLTSPPSLSKFLIAAISFASITGITIFMALPFLKRKGLWASMSTIIPITMLIITYWRMEAWAPSVTFAFCAVLLAALFVYAAHVRMTEDSTEPNASLAAYAAGATAAISLGIAMVLRDAWLSFALTLQIVALAHIWRLTHVNGLRTLALILTLIVFVRLTLNGSIFDYGNTGSLPVINWLFYGYALTAGLLAYAAYLFKQGTQHDRLISMLKASSILLSIGFVTLEIRVIFSDGGRLSSELTGLEAALQTINWVGATTILYWYETRNSDPLLCLLRRFMTVLSAFSLLIGGAFMNNVFSYRPDVGRSPIFNLLFLQYFIPAILYSTKAYIARRAGRTISVNFYGTIAFLLLWYWCTAEVYRTFHPNGTGGATTDWEWYAYSFVWLVYAILLLVTGLKFGQNRVRMAGLMVLGAVVFKVFLIDMNQLEGISRALSFMGLGAALIGLGYLYQKLNMTSESDNRHSLEQA